MENRDIEKLHSNRFDMIPKFIRRHRMRPLAATASRIGVGVLSLGLCLGLTLASPVVLAAQEFRTIDGTGNNLANPDYGAAGTALLRLMEPDYEDGVWMPAGADRPSAREISNTLCDQSGSVPTSGRDSGYVWQWGQFVDHDIDLTVAADPTEAFAIPVPIGDPYFDPESTGVQTIGLDRSNYDPATGTEPGNPRQQMNSITSFIDASNIYGSDPVRADALRSNDGTGRLKTSAGDLLPFNTPGLPNAGGPSAELFLAGDVRANEQAALTAMHTLFVREHNRLADKIRSASSDLSGEEIYQKARAIVGAEMQVITYKEFLPVLLGPDALAPYSGYDPSVNAGISNSFSTGLYRFGHSMLSPTLLRLGKNGKEAPEGHLPLRDAFFNPARITDEGGIEPLIRGLARQRSQAVDVLVIDDVRNFLFGPPGMGGFDLAALNIQRGRDHGLRSYNQVRANMGLTPAESFADITSDEETQARLEEAYEDVNDIDVWGGALAEDHAPGAIVGELLLVVLKDQFERLRDGDRFWYQNVMSKKEARKLEKTRLSDVIRHNTSIRGEVPKNVFLVKKNHNKN